ncbi:MAG TPA: hypothetical protein VFH50_07125 [Acidimicrobiales bacterium]|nr:hypothetical protein [Acidimicrobiales bacterium]
MAAVRRRVRAAAVAVPAAALLGGWAAGVFGAAPPVYDGLPLSAEPYRYLKPPPGLATTAAPTSAAETVTVTGPAGAQTVELSTTETPPQATIIFSTGAFSAPSGERIVLRIAPVAPPAQPGRGRIDGNVYSFTATGPGPGGVPQPVGVAAGQVITLALRATGTPGAPTVDRFDSGVWRPLATTHVPPSEYSVSADRLGDFALILPPGSSGGGGGGGALIGAVIGGVLVVLAAVIVLIRRSRR